MAEFWQSSKFYLLKNMPPYGIRLEIMEIFAEILPSETDTLCYIISLLRFKINQPFIKSRNIIDYDWLPH